MFIAFTYLKILNKISTNLEMDTRNSTQALDTGTHTCTCTQNSIIAATNNLLQMGIDE